MSDVRADADARLAAVRARDARADGSFVYGVRTTGVYCRPSCPSRPARPENLRFFDTPRAAREAGFRPCLRCDPDAPGADAFRAGMVAALCRLLETADPIPTLDMLARQTGLSPWHLQRVFKARTGLTPRAWAIAHRAARLRESLRQGASVTRAAMDAGYGSGSRLHADAHRALGMTPSRFRAGGAGMAIRFAVGECSLGSLLVASTDRGVCAILLGDDPDALLRDLQDRFPEADLQGGDADFEELVARVAGLVEAPGTGVDLPLDIRGTAFQRRVWMALRDIPAGRTVDYSELARRIGAPSAARAVAGACAANPLAVAIPCHRVLRRDGGPSGYRWGVDRRRALLEREADAGGG